MEINKQEAENILNMLNSEDKDNGFVAFKAIDAHDFEGTKIGYLIYLYKFSKWTIDEWVTNAPKSAKILQDSFDLTKVLTYAEGLSFIIQHNCDKEVITMFLDRHVKELTTMLGAMGYPTDKIALNISLKE